MVSYKRLDPEQVVFSGGAFSDQHPPVNEETTVPEAEETPLMRWSPRCSVTKSLLVIGALLLLLLGGWLLGTRYWLLSSSSTLPHPAPAPAKDRATTNSTLPIPPKGACAAVPEAWRFDCFPERGAVVTQAMCEARNCCFVPQAVGRNGVPWCFYPQDYPSYSLMSLQSTPLGQTGTLERRQQTYYPSDIMTLQLQVWEETDTRLHIKITDPSSPRYEVPIEVPTVTEKALSPQYVLELTKEPFGVVVRRASTGTLLLNSSVAPLFFADQFLQMSSSLPSGHIYGLGEHRDAFQHNIQWNTLTMWARDVPPMEKTNLYGVHPFYLGLEEGGLAHGFFLLNSNAMDVVLQPAPAVTWRTIGGVLDFYLFLGPEPASVVQQYLEVVGRPAMPAYWALGFHLCRWGYGTSNATWELVKGMRSYGIPQDVQWNDIDYMDRFLDFTHDPVHFDTLTDMVKDLHAHNQHYVPILDPGISSTQPPGAYWAFDEGLKRGVFIRDADGNTLIGKVWPGLTAYPDFSDEATHEWWFENLQRFYKLVPFDGIWIDMNEPSNFLDGSTNGCPDNNIENPPYTPGVLGRLLRSKTVCASAQQKLSSHYNLHSLYGLHEAKATSSALTRLLGKRPFIISRSSFPGQGQYSGHWLGDNRSQWKDMAASIAGILSFNIFGMPLVGADVCGFSEQTDEELCVRWTQLGAFYPFSRNHNALDSKAQDPLAFSPSARAAMQSALLLRYSLFPLLYTLFHQAHVQGHTVARPLMFEFPHDPHTYALDRQFLWGRDLLVTPVLLPAVDSVEGYFPAGRWYNYYTGDSFLSAGQNMSLSAPLDKINLHLREGSITPTQRPNVTLWVSRRQPLHLLCALSEDASASGELFWDDGESLHTYEEQQYAYVLFSVRQNVLSSAVLHAHVEASYTTVESASVYGLQSKPQQVLVNGVEVAFTYNNKCLHLADLGLNLNQNFTVSWQSTAPHPYTGRSTAPHPYTGRSTAPHPYTGRSTAPHAYTGRPTAPHPYTGRSTAPHPYTGRPTAPHPYTGRSTAPHPYRQVYSSSPLHMQVHGSSPLHMWQVYSSSPLYRQVYSSSPLHRQVYSSSPLHRQVYSSSPLHRQAHSSSPLHWQVYSSSPLHMWQVYSSSPLHMWQVYSSSPLHRQVYSSSPLHMWQVYSSSPLHMWQVYSSSPLHRQAHSSSPLHRQVHGSSPLQAGLQLLTLTHAGPRLLTLTQAGPQLLTLTQAGPQLLTLTQAGPQLLTLTQAVAVPFSSALCVCCKPPSSHGPGTPHKAAGPGLSPLLSPGMAAVKALQQWCRLRCEGYRDVRISNMTSSFRDGLAFCALIHHHRPELIDFDSLKKEDVYENNKLAFSVAEQQLGIPALLDAEDMVALAVPDRLSILTYVSQYYNYFHGRNPIGGLAGVKRPAEAAPEQQQPAGKKNAAVSAKVFPSPGFSKENQPPVDRTQPCPTPSATPTRHRSPQDVPAEPRTGTLSNKCVSCNKHVHLVQRHLVDGKLYHRSCAKTLSGNPFTSDSSHSRLTLASDPAVKAGPLWLSHKASAPPSVQLGSLDPQPGHSVSKSANPPRGLTPRNPDPIKVFTPRSPDPPRGLTPKSSNPPTSFTSVRLSSPQPTVLSHKAKAPSVLPSVTDVPVPAPRASIASKSLQSKLKFFQAADGDSGLEERGAPPSKTSEPPRIHTSSRSSSPQPSGSSKSPSSRAHTKPEPATSSKTSTSLELFQTAEGDNCKAERAGGIHRVEELGRQKEAPGGLSLRVEEFGGQKKDQEQYAAKASAAANISKVIQESSSSREGPVSKPRPSPAGPKKEEQGPRRVRLRANPSLLSDLSTSTSQDPKRLSPTPRSQSTDVTEGPPSWSRPTDSTGTPTPRSISPNPSGAQSQSPSDWRSCLKPVSKEPRPTSSSQASPKLRINGSDPPQSKCADRPQTAPVHPTPTPLPHNSPSSTAPENPKFKADHIPQAEILKELQQIEESMNELERTGVELELKLRTSEDHGEDEAVMNDLMVDWFSLIRNKQVAMRRESELVYIGRTQELEEEQPTVEQELRRLMDKPGRECGKGLEGWSWGAASEGRNWGAASGGRNWGAALGGRNWGAASGGRNWGAASGGRNWGAASGGRNWGAASGGRNWGAASGGRNWGAASGGRNWGAASGGRNWGAASGGRNNWGAASGGRNNWGAASEGRNNWGAASEGRNNWGAASEGRNNWGAASEGRNNWGAASEGRNNWGAASEGRNNWGAASEGRNNWGRRRRPELGSGVGRPELGSGVGRPELGSGVGRPELGSGVGRPELGSGVGRPEQLGAASGGRNNWGAASEGRNNWGAASEGRNNWGAASEGRNNWGAASEGRNNWGAASEGRNNWGAASEGRNNWGAASEGRNNWGAASEGRNNWGAASEGRNNWGAASGGRNWGAASGGRNWGAASGGRNWGAASGGRNNWGAASGGRNNWGAASEGRNNWGAASEGRNNWGAASEGRNNWGAASEGRNNWGAASEGRNNWGAASEGRNNWGAASEGRNNWGAASEGRNNWGAASEGRNNWGAASEGRNNWGAASEGRNNWGAASEGRNNWGAASEGRNNWGAASEGRNNWGAASEGRNNWGAASEGRNNWGAASEGRNKLGCGKAGTTGERRQKAGTTGERRQKAGTTGVRRQKAGTTGVRRQKAGTTGVRRQKAGTTGERRQKAGTTGERRQKAGTTGERRQKAGTTGERRQKAGTGERRQKAGTGERRQAAGTEVRRPQAAGTGERRQKAGTGERRQAAGTEVRRPQAAGTEVRRPPHQYYYHLKQSWERRREKQLMDKLVTIVNDRNAIVEGLDQDRLREEEEDEQLHQLMESFNLKKDKKKKSPMSRLFGWGSKES
uniref:Uncharacterized protein n=1 Tax=Knipowitschia caucasica TaxID=637954 RepID=A0AAV2LKQ6_KNICA